MKKRASESMSIGFAQSLEITIISCHQNLPFVQADQLLLTLPCLQLWQHTSAASFLDDRSKQRCCAITSTSGCPVAQAPRKNFVLAIILSGWKPSEISSTPGLFWKGFCVEVVIAGHVNHS
jgi:hypothetical protein